MPDYVTFPRYGKVTRPQAARAAYLRNRYRMSWTVIAVVMGEYHGAWFGSYTWKHACVSFGIPVHLSPRGNAYQAKGGDSG